MMEVLGRMRNELPDDLHYHSVEHTLDVLDAAVRIADLEGVTDREKELLKAAALLHDSGFVLGYQEHEQLGCVLARQILPNFGYPLGDVDQVCALIMATKVPQQPSDLLEEIICDADLDYLGRQDFMKIGGRLFKEFSSRGVVKDAEDWHCLQIRFLENHRYFTRTNQSEREAAKREHLAQLKRQELNCD